MTHPTITMKVTKQWADDVDEVNRLDHYNKNFDAFYTLCALQIGNPNMSRDGGGSLDFNFTVSDQARFSQLFLEFFEKKPGPFDFISYMIWYEREQAAQKLCRK